MAGLAGGPASERLGSSRLSLADRIRAYLADHPYSGDPIESADMVINGEDMRVIGDPPKRTLITALLLENPVPGIFSFAEGVLTVNLLPKALHYRALYWDEYDSIALERVEV